jgi:hypothetical protein
MEEIAMLQLSQPLSKKSTKSTLWGGGVEGKGLPARKFNNLATIC